MNKRTGVICLSIIILGATILINSDRILLAIGDHLVVKDQLTPVDVIHVIAGDDYRTEYAIQLYKQGYAKYIFFTGGWCKLHGYEHGVHGRELAMTEGISADVIFTDDSPVTSTYSEVERLHAWIEKNPGLIHSVMVVSDPFHMSRSRWTYQQVLGKNIGLVMAPVPIDQTPYMREWWTDEASRAYVINEYEKSVYYVLRYQLTWGTIKNWLATFDQE